MFFQRLHQSEECAAAKFFVNFRHFARQACRAVAQNRQSVGKRLRDAVRRFIQDDGSVFDAQVFERAAAFAGACGEKSQEKKLFIRQARRCECREQRGRARNWNHGNLMANGQRDQTEAGIGNQRHAGIADERNARALFHGVDKLRSSGNFIVLVIADERLVNFEVIQKFQRVARVFAGNLIDFLEDAQGPQGDVFQIADRRGDKI